MPFVLATPSSTRFCTGEKSMRRQSRKLSGMSGASCGRPYILAMNGLATT
jgi:hypothetical protein